MFGYENVGQILLRLMGIFAIALIVVRLMGNRTVGQLSPFDFVLMVGIGDIVASVAMDIEYHMLVGVEALVGLLILQQLLSHLSLRSKVLRKWFEGPPVELIENGKLLQDNFKKTQFNYDDLRQELHKFGLDMTKLQDIKLARLESCGQFTVIKTPETEPLTRRDFENYLHSLSDNPLSPQGQSWTQIEAALADIRYIAQTLRRQETGTNHGSETQPTQNTH